MLFPHLNVDNYFNIIKNKNKIVEIKPFKKITAPKTTLYNTIIPIFKVTKIVHCRAKEVDPKKKVLAA